MHNNERPSCAVWFMRPILRRLAMCCLDSAPGGPHPPVELPYDVWVGSDEYTYFAEGYTGRVSDSLERTAVGTVRKVLQGRCRSLSMKSFNCLTRASKSHAERDRQHKVYRHEPLSRQRRELSSRQAGFSSDCLAQTQQLSAARRRRCFLEAMTAQNWPVTSSMRKGL